MFKIFLFNLGVYFKGEQKAEVGFTAVIMCWQKLKAEKKHIYGLVNDLEWFVNPQLFYPHHRYIVAIHPMSLKCQWIQSHNRTLLTASWLVGAAYAYIPIDNTYTSAFDLGNQVYYQCIFDNDISERKRAIFTVTNFALTFAIPLAIMAFSYLSIMRRLRCSSITVYSTSEGAQATNHNLSPGIQGSNETKIQVNRFWFLISEFV